jgi:hypothetical protein
MQMLLEQEQQRREKRRLSLQISAAFLFLGLTYQCSSPFLDRRVLHTCVLGVGANKLCWLPIYTKYLNNYLTSSGTVGLRHRRLMEIESCIFSWERFESDDSVAERWQSLASAMKGWLNFPRNFSRIVVVTR